MNCEFKIRELEAELAHVRKLQQIRADQLDRHETWQEYTGSRMYAVEAALEKLTQTVDSVSQNIDRFLAGLKGKNGHE